MKKSEIRKKFLQKRKELTPAQIQSASQRIHDWFFQSLAVHSYTTIHVFLPIKERDEIDTWLIISTLQTDFATHIVLPRMNSNGDIDSLELTSKTKFERNDWGITEPIFDEQLIVNNEQINLVILPLLAFDKRGYRVGYGKGMYDKFLAQCRADVVKVGVSAFEPVEDISDINGYDVKMDFCITPNRIYQFS